MAIRMLPPWLRAARKKRFHRRGILDRVDRANLKAAYSIYRRLVGSYYGPAVLVRRASDDATAQIGFLSDGTLDVAAIAAHCTTNDGYVVTVYQQWGSGNDISHAASTPEQPKIYDGTTGQVLVGSIPAATWDGTDDHLDAGEAFGLTGNPGLDVFEVHQRTDQATADRFFDLGGSNGIFLQHQSATTVRIGSGAGNRNMAEAVDETSGLYSYHLRHASGGQIGAAELYMSDAALSEDSSTNPTTTPSLSDVWCYWGYAANYTKSSNVELIVFGVSSGNALSAADAARLRADQVATYGG